MGILILRNNSAGLQT